MDGSDRTPCRSLPLVKTNIGCHLQRQHERLRLRRGAVHPQPLGVRAVNAKTESWPLERRTLRLALSVVGPFDLTASGQSSDVDDARPFLQSVPRLRWWLGLLACRACLRCRMMLSQVQLVESTASSRAGHQKRAQHVVQLAWWFSLLHFLHSLRPGGTG